MSNTSDSNTPRDQGEWPETNPPETRPVEKLPVESLTNPTCIPGDEAFVGQGTFPLGEMGTLAANIPNYEILAELGRGAMGVVYRARHTSLGREVALKMILVGGHASEQDRQRFLAEAQAIASLQHPGIVQIYDYGSWGGLPYFAMELCPVGNLARKLAGKPVPDSEAAGMIEQLANAIQIAHENGIVHRDLKPGNILLTLDETLKVTDFGLARRIEESQGLTQTGAVVGTPCYMAPEQALGLKDIGPAADIYSLGAILYELLTGRPPFLGEVTLEVLRQVVDCEPALPRTVQPKVDRDLEAVCLKCLEKEPKHRYASARDLAEDMRQYLAGEPVAIGAAYRRRRTFRWAKRRFRVIAGLVGILTIVAATLFVGLHLGKNDTTNEGLVENQQKEKNSDDQLRETIEILKMWAGRETNEMRRKDISELIPLAKANQPGGNQQGVTYLGAASCSNPGCHGGNPPSESWRSKGFELICRCDESIIWQKEDKHADAYNVLLSERGMRMSKLLGYDVTRNHRCLRCHVGVADDDSMTRSRQSGFGFSVKEGVTCVVCHGPALEWIVRHGELAQIANWRTLTRKEKEDKYGMRDLRDPIKRAKLCVSCHIGNIAEGKFITHDIYAVGHPILPSFELATFGNEMPRHWQLLREKPPQVQKNMGYDGRIHEDTELLLAGATVALEASMRILATDASNALKREEGEWKGVDRANHECSSCHHEIASRSFRQNYALERARLHPGYRPVLDRESMRRWPTVLIRLALEQDLKKDETEDSKRLVVQYQTILSKLQVAFANGSPLKIGNAAVDMDKLTGEIADRIKANPPDSQAARVLLARIPDLYSDEGLDYDSARQVAWGYEVMYRELSGAKAGGALPALVELEKHLKLRLPLGRMGNSKESPLEKEMSERLKIGKDYDPIRFRELLRKLAPSPAGGK